MLKAPDVLYYSALEYTLHMLQDSLQHSQETEKSSTVPLNVTVIITIDI